MMPGNAIGRHVFVEERMKKLAELAETTPLNRVERAGRSVGFITAGTCYQYVKEAMGDTVNYLKLGLVWPLPESNSRAQRDCQRIFERCRRYRHFGRTGRKD